MFIEFERDAIGVWEGECRQCWRWPCPRSQTFFDKYVVLRLDVVCSKRDSVPANMKRAVKRGTDRFWLLPLHKMDRKTSWWRRRVRNICLVERIAKQIAVKLPG